MKMIIAIIRPSKLSSVKSALTENSFTGITVTPVKGCGSQRGTVERYRGSEYIVNLIDKIEIKVIVSDENLDRAIKIIMDTAKTGEFGDGKIFVVNIEEAIRIRTNERGQAALETEVLR